MNRSAQPFSQVGTSLRTDSKSKGGINGISQSPAALQRWFLTSHERAFVTTALKEAYSVHDSDRVGIHKEAAPKRLARAEDDVQKLVSCFTSGMMTSP